MRCKFELELVGCEDESLGEEYRGWLEERINEAFPKQTAFVNVFPRYMAEVRIANVDERERIINYARHLQEQYPLY